MTQITRSTFVSWISCPFEWHVSEEQEEKKKKELKKRVGGREREREIDNERAVGTVNTSESLKNSRPSYERVREIV